MLVAIPAAVGALLGVGLLALDFHVGTESSSFSLSFTPKRPKPIAVSKAACPYLDAVRSATAAAGASMTGLLEASDGPHGKLVVTPRSTALYRRMPGQLGALDFALRVSATQVPHKIAWRFVSVAGDVEQGRAAIGKSNPASYFLDVMMPLSDGVQRLSYASDLVGAQCGFVVSDYRIF